MSAFNQNNLASYKVFNGLAPKGEPRAMAIDVDFSVQSPYVFDLELAQTADKLEFVQAIYADNSTNPFHLSITCGISGQTVTWPPFTQGYQPVLVPNNPSFNISTAAAFTGIVRLHMLNFPMPSCIWSATRNALYRLISAANTNSNLIATGARLMRSMILNNSGVGFAYAKFYNKASAPTVGTDTPILTIGVPPGQSVVIGQDDLQGYAFSLGIGIGITGVAADNDTTPILLNQVTANVTYQ